jgi:hypothetical protein
MAGVTVVLTSCARFDLLRETLASFQKHNDYPLARFLLIEDSGDAAVFDVTEEFPQLDIEVVLNIPSLGQHASIDRAYSMVDTDYIFHCEDDWLFLRKGIIADSVALMDADPSIALVWARGDEGAPQWIKKTPRTVQSSVLVRPIDPRAHHLWGNFTFNPGLRRLSHYKMMPGGYAVNAEGRTSIFLKRHGYRMVILAETGVGHIGGGERSTGSPKASIEQHTSAGSGAKLFKKLKRLPRSLKLRASHFVWLLRLRLKALYKA